MSPDRRTARGGWACTPPTSTCPSGSEETLAAFLDRRARGRRGHRPRLRRRRDELCEFVLGGGKRLRPAFAYWGWRGRGRRPGRPGRSTRCCARSPRWSCPGQRAGARRRHGRLRHPPRPPGHARRVRRAGTAARRWRGRRRRVRRRRRRSWSATSPWSGPTSCCAAPGLDRRRRPGPRRSWDTMRTEVTGGQYLDLLRRRRRAARPARRADGRPLQERRLHRPAAAAAGRGDRRRGPGPGRPATAASGCRLGEAFQLRDDVLGVFGDPAVTGKSADDDLREGKQTLLHRAGRGAGRRRGRRPRWPDRAGRRRPGRRRPDARPRPRPARASRRPCPASSSASPSRPAPRPTRHRARPPLGRRRPRRRLDALAVAATTRDGADVRTRPRAAPTASSSSAPGWPGWPRRCGCAAPGARSPSSSGPTGPGGRAGALDWSAADYALDTGPSVFTAPEMLADTLGRRRREARGAADPRCRWTPTYRAQFADGSHLDVHADPDAFAAEVRRLCGPAEAARAAPLPRRPRRALPAAAAHVHRPQPRLAARTCSAPSWPGWPAAAGSAGCPARRAVLRRRAAAPAVQLPGALRRRLAVPGDRRLRRDRPAGHRRRGVAPGGRDRRGPPGAGRRRRRRRGRVPVRARR